MTQEQQAIVAHRNGRLLVSAAAGSGKTWVLVERVLDRVRKDKLNLDQFLIITFTKAAAAELRSRIQEALAERIALFPEDAHLRKQSLRLYRAQISTIDSFCQTLLQEEGQALGLNPDFQVLNDSAGDLLQTAVLQQLLEQHYAAQAPGDDFSALLDCLVPGRELGKLAHMVRNIYEKLQSQEDPKGWLAEQQQLFALEGIESIDATIWAKYFLEDRLQMTRAWKARLEDLQDKTNASKKIAKAFKVLINKMVDGDPEKKKKLNSLAEFECALQKGWDAAHTAGALYYGRVTKAKGNNDAELEAYFTAEHALYKHCCQKQMTEPFAKSGQQLMHDLKALVPAMRALLNLVAEFMEAFAAAKAQRNWVDYSDMEHMALQLLRSPEGEATPLALQLQESLREVMVDEYQDTNALQNAIFHALTAGGKTLFTVGDVKQSIYRFRRADPGIFMAQLEQAVPGAEAAEGQAKKLFLSRNFRSRAAVLDAVNFVFEGLMSKEAGELEYSQEQRLNLGREDFPPNPQAQPELHVLSYEKEANAEGEGPELRLQEVEAEYIAQRIQELMAENFQVTAGGETRPLAWSDIVILARSMSKNRGPLTAALRRHQIPYVQSGELDVSETMEIATCVSYLQILSNPHQDIPLISVLHSPLYGITPDQLAQIRLAAPYTDFYTALCACREQAFLQRFLADYEALRAYAQVHTAPDVLWQLYACTGALQAFAALEDGQTRQKNLLALYAYARSFQNNGHQTLQDLVHHFQSLQDAGKGLQLKIGGGNGVRLMTIHGSKGLEFPVVILAGLGDSFNTQDEKADMLVHSSLGLGPKWDDTEKRIRYSTIAREAVQQKLHREMLAEEMRLLYVAMTRAQEKLILMCTRSALTVPGSNHKTKLQKMQAFATYPLPPQVVLEKGCVAEWLIPLAMTREQDGEALRDGDLPANGAYYAKADTPWKIVLVENPAVPKAEASALPQATPAQAPASLEADWSYPHGAVTAIPARLTATQLKAQSEPAPATEALASRAHFRQPDFSGQAQALTPTQRGTALHRFMELCQPEQATTPAGVAQELARLQAQGYLTAQEAQAVAPERVTAFFTSEIGTQALGSQLHREFPFALLVDAGQYYGQPAQGEELLLHGFVDLWFETEAGIVIVDFKTDRITQKEAPARAEHYRPQLEVYAQALEAITGRPVVQRCLWFLALNQAYSL